MTTTNPFSPCPIYVYGMLHTHNACSLCMAQCNYLPFSQAHVWMDDLRFYVLFNSISVISGRCLADNEWPCAMRLFTVEKISPQVRIELGRLDQ